ncbi:uncharacterized protein B0H18DRAFT_1027791 [Fomitopsis serialis]|uniref:uncharacterized protein n=1 Tax=Fomitopsis serialis TaxID=139415 RepID=UPI002007F1E5|nr:uncharacterized protein B0H18DRAFT_1027791 [Neoantrodia serialis]KAH9919370.1 hypothetical protein B0H18DRAFT_1027791 [Neoantrodia serialis]
MADMIKGAQLDEERWTRLVSKSMVCAKSFERLANGDSCRQSTRRDDIRLCGRRLVPCPIIAHVQAAKDDPMEDQAAQHTHDIGPLGPASADEQREQHPVHSTGEPFLHLGPTHFSQLYRKDVTAQPKQLDEPTLLPSPPHCAWSSYTTSLSPSSVSSISLSSSSGDFSGFHRHRQEENAFAADKHVDHYSSCSARGPSGPAATDWSQMPQPASVGITSTAVPPVPQGSRSPVYSPPQPLQESVENKGMPARQAADYDEEACAPLSEELVKLHLSAHAKQFFGSRSLDEGEAYLRKLPLEHRWRLVNRLVSFAAVSGVADSRLVGDFFSRVASKGLCSPDVFDAGFSPIMEILDVIVLHSSNALILVTIMLKGTQLNGEQLNRLVCKAMGDASELLLALLL